MKCPRCDFVNPADSKFCKECGTQLILPDGFQVSKTMTLETPAEELTRGIVFAGRYEIIEELGAGGMGRVYRAFDKKIEEEVALKLIRSEIAAEKRTVDRFRNEIKTTRKITHKNVCRTHDLGEEGKSLFITMEYVRGEDLKSLMRRTRVLAAGTAVSIARQVAEGLGEAHRLGVVHRDLKPGNIMIDKDGNAKIMDFGIARSLARAGTTAEGAVIGTPEYMSPEQVEGKPADQRADIYSLGIILFEMVTGRAPFEGDTSLAIAHKHRYEPAPDPRTLNPQIPDELGHTILRCLEKEREVRYQTTEELLSELVTVEAVLPIFERLTPGLPATKRKPGTSKTITVNFTMHKLIVPALVLVAVVVMAIILFRPTSKGPPIPAPTGPPSIAVLPLTDLSSEKDQAAQAEGIADTLLVSLAMVDGLDVRGRHSSFQFTAQDNPQVIGSKLNADYLVIGSFLKSGDHIRITVQLIDSATGTPIWANKFDGGAGEIFNIQDRISSTIISRLNVELVGDERKALEKRYTSDPEAYELYLKGNYAERGFANDVLSAILFYLEAARKDPAFVLAYVALARCHKIIGFDYDGFPKETHYKQSKEALDKAFALDSENGEAFAVRAGLKFSYENDRTGADRDYQSALQLSPKSLFVLKDHSKYLFTKGEMDGFLSNAKQIIEIDPLDPTGYYLAGVAYYGLRRYEDSIGSYLKALEVDPGWWGAHGWSTYTYLAQRKFGKAREAAKHLEHQSPDDYLFLMAVIEASLGDRGEAEKHKKALDDYSRSVYKKPVDPIYDAAYYAALGDRARTLENFNRQLVENPNEPVKYLFWHFFDKYRSDPEFIVFFKKVGFEMK
jgi:serine/threonine protein kinase/tetratricopeptide (TPR) repeat protein